MSSKTFTLSNTFYHYLIDHSLGEVAVLRELREFTAAHPMARMQISPEQGQLMALCD